MIIQWLGFSAIKRLRSKISARPKEYYPQQHSCQIPNLSFLFTQFLGERESGVFVEVGAFDGTTVSNTWGLASRNWKGILIEPIPVYAARCIKNHRHHPNVEVVQLAVGTPESNQISLRIAGPLTTANLELNTEYEKTKWARKFLRDETYTANCVDLNSLLEEKHIEPGFDLLVVDVEGYEQQVFSSFNLDYWHPKMMIVELADTHPELASTRKSDSRLTQSILFGGYQIVFKDSINTVFVDSKTYVRAQSRMK
jgi:FkbM family methyltransferase